MISISNLPLFKLDKGSVTLGIFAVIILVTGFPFGNPKTFEDIWVMAWTGVFWFALLGAVIKSMKMLADKKIN